MWGDTMMEPGWTPPRDDPRVLADQVAALKKKIKKLKKRIDRLEKRQEATTP